MKTHFFKRGIAGLLSLVMCLTALVGLGTTTAFAAGEQAEVYLISFPRSGDANLDYSGTWGHSNLHYMNGWYSGESKYTTIRAMHSYDGNICYCIEPGTPQDTGDRYTSKDETFWDNLPSDFNSTISPYDMKLFIGRIMQYGYTGPISTSWRSQNASDAETLAQAMATQVLIWETVVGERDEDFNHISPGSYDAVKSVVSTAHPLYSQFISYYNSIEASVQRHSAIPSFMAKTPGKAQNVELAWNGTNYTATLTDSNNVLSNYSFSANEDGIPFSVSGNKLVITAATAPSDSVRITASKSGATRRGIITWTDGRYAPGSGIQDVISYAQEVNDPVQAFLNLKVSYGSAKIIKTSEDGKVDNLTFTVTGNGINQTVKTNSKGEIQIDNLMPGVYTVTEMDYDKYEPQESRRVTVVSGQVSTVTFNNKLKRGDLQIVKSSEDNLNEGVTFHLYGTSLSGIAVDEYAVNEKSTKNVWWKCRTCGYEWKAVVKARVKGGMCPVCAERAVLQGYNDLGTTDPHLLSEWDYEKNSKWTPSNVSRNSMKVVWWKCGAGHSYRAKITDRTIEQKGCPQCEAEFQQALPQMLIMMYGAQNGITVKSNSDSELGMRLVAYLPELHCAVDIAGATVTEKREQSVKAHICQSNRLGYYLIKRTADTSQMAAEIKTLFIRNHIYLHTDSEKDVQVLRERFLEWKNRNACKLNGKY